VPKVVYRSIFYDKHATARGGIRTLVLSHRSLQFAGCSNVFLLRTTERLASLDSVLKDVPVSDSDGICKYVFCINLVYVQSVCLSVVSVCIN